MSDQAQDPTYRRAVAASMRQQASKLLDDADALEGRDPAPMLDRQLAESMISDLEDADGQWHLPSRVASQFRHALAELDRALRRVAAIGVDQEPTPQAWWRSLASEQRRELMSDCCHGCGSLDLSCHCWNDE